MGGSKSVKGSAARRIPGLTANIKLSRAQLEAAKTAKPGEAWKRAAEPPPLLEADRRYVGGEGDLPGFKDPVRPLVDNVEGEQPAQFASGMRHSLRDALRDVLGSMTIEDVNSAIGQQRAAQYSDRGAAMGGAAMIEKAREAQRANQTQASKADGLSSELDRLRIDLDEQGDVINALGGRLVSVLVDSPPTGPGNGAIVTPGPASPMVNIVRSLRDTVLNQTSRIRYLLSTLDLS